MAAGRKMRDENEVRQYLSASQRTGVSIPDWARPRGIDGRSLRAWVINLGRRDSLAPRRRTTRAKPSAPRALVELVPMSQSRQVTGAARYIVHIADGRVEFGDDASMATLRQVIEALRSC